MYFITSENSVIKICLFAWPSANKAIDEHVPENLCTCYDTVCMRECGSLEARTIIAFHNGRGTGLTCSDVNSSHYETLHITATDCGQLEAVPYGSVSFSSTTYNSTASYSCNAGYTLVGDSSVTCLSSGLWSNNTAVECNREF